jgi:hypothetical protein
MRGSYVSWTPERGRQVCALIAGGQSLSSIGRMAGMPSFNTLLRWRRDHPQFQEAYLEACASRPPGRGPHGPYGTKAQIAARHAARPPKKPVGRPCLYTEELVEEVCARIAAGESMDDLGEDPQLPAKMSLYNWLDEHEHFRRRYGAACEMRADLMAEEALAIADDASGDFIRTEKGLQPN